MALLLCLRPMAGAQSVQGKSYVALGDSISSGYGLEDDTLSFTQQVAQDNGLELTNLAQDGETSASLLDKLQTDRVSTAVAQADIITITVGGNDLMNALYAYLTGEYNQHDPAAPTTEEDIKSAVMGGDMGLVTFALGVVSEFPSSEQAAQALHDVRAHLTQLVVDIRTENPQAQLVLVEQYDPYGHLVKKLCRNPLFASSAQTLYATLGEVVTGLNEIIDTVGEQQGCPVAEVYEAFESARENPCNASVSLNMKLNLDFHPNAYGHTLIAQQVSSLLTAPGESRTPAQPVYGVGVSQPPQTGDGEDLGTWMALIGGTGVCLVLCLQKSHLPESDRCNGSQSGDTGRRRMK